MLPLLLVAGACSDSMGSIDSGTERSALAVNVATVHADDGYDIRREFAGRLEPRRQSALGFELGGELTEVTVVEGDQVAAGSIIAQLDTDRLRARRAEAQAAHDQARSALELAQATLARTVDAASFDGVSAQEVDLARDKATTAAAGLAATAARLEALDVDIAKSSLRAPYDAVVVNRHYDEGQIVAAGQPVLSVQELAPPEVRIGIAGDLAQTFTAGDVHELRVGSRDATATVRSVVPNRNLATRTVDVIFTLEADTGALPGDLARLSLAQRVDQDGYWVPISALADGGRGLWTAYVAVPEEGTALASTGATHALEPRAVEILYEDRDRVFVRGALSAGDQLVTGGLQRVVPDQLVRLASTRDPSSGS